MNCDRAKRLLSRYMDNELVDEQLLAQLEDHLHQCPGCTAELNTLTAMKRLIVQKQRISVKEGFLERITSSIGLDQAQLVRIKWLPEAGNLARKLIPVPALVAVVMFFLVFASINGLNPVDEYIFADLSTQEMGVLSGYIDSSDLLTQVVF